MSHARLCVVLTVGVVTIASACAEHHSADRSTYAPNQRRFVETPVSAESEDEVLTPASGVDTPRGLRTVDCPMQLPGATLTTMPALGGGALVFTTSRESAKDELRRRVLILRDAYVESVRAPATGLDTAAHKSIEVEADYVDEPSGARIEVRAVHSNDVDDLRQRLRADAAVMKDSQRCPALEPTAAKNAAIDSRH